MKRRSINWRIFPVVNPVDIKCFFLNKDCLPQLEKAMATHASTLAWKIPWMEEPGKSGTWLSDFTFNFHFPLSCTGEGNGKPLQCSCLENPRDGRAWWAAVYGVAQSRTRLKRLSSSSSIPSISIHVVANGRISSFLGLNNIPWYIDHILFIHWWMSRLFLYLGSF